MPRIPTASRSKTFLDSASIATSQCLHFLLPIANCAKSKARHGGDGGQWTPSEQSHPGCFESLFFSALSQAASCPAHRALASARSQCQRPLRNPFSSVSRSKSPKICSANTKSYTEFPFQIVSKPLARDGGKGRDGPFSGRAGLHTSSSRRTRQQDSKFFQPSFAAGSNLPRGFYEDVENLQTALQVEEMVDYSEEELDERENSDESDTSLEEQLNLLKSVRGLEEKLARAKAALHKSLDRRKSGSRESSAIQKQEHAIVLSKEDYLNLVDLYFYSHQSRFGPETPDHSPTPLFLDDYSFKLSADFSGPETEPDDGDAEHEEDTSPLKHIEEMLKKRQLREISVMQAFVELLLDECSSNRALFDVYKKFPDPGVASLPRGVVRLFLQRMSTPSVKSEKAMLRYLSLIDDMQRASLPITSAEWSSAIYLAGRSFARVTENEVAASFRIWREMEQEAGVKSNHATFNILFDIAVRAGKHALGQSVLKEMHDRDLRLNRLGRVSLIYYHGLRGDGDGVRKAYRDFVEAGEIVDTLVLNCVIASLINAQEPTAAEQVYERMKSLQERLRKGRTQDGEEALFMKYPPPGSTMIDMQMASNSLGRTLLKAAHLREVLPDHHAQLQNSMPLTPDHITFRTMIAHHASTSGDLDRLTVLLNDMTVLFELPMTALNFQLLFKGFAIHGGTRSEQARWTSKRLDLVWTACRQAIKGSAVKRDGGEEVAGPGLTLPSVQEAEAEPSMANAQIFLETASGNTTPRKMGAWNEFVLDLGIYPRERLKPLYERKAPAHLEEGEEYPHSPFVHTEDEVRSGVDAASTDEPDADGDDEYSLPSASSHFRPPQSPDGSSDVAVQRAADTSVRATKTLVVWILRAYQRVTKSRTRVEEVWFQVRKVWRPQDDMERDAVVRVLRRALTECDKLGHG